MATEQEQIQSRAKAEAAARRVATVLLAVELGHATEQDLDPPVAALARAAAAVALLSLIRPSVGGFKPVTVDIDPAVSREAADRAMPAVMKEARRAAAEAAKDPYLPRAVAADRMARTVATRAESLASLELVPAVEELTGPLKKVWLSSVDPDVRPLHRSLHGKTAALDKPFWRELGTGRELRFPGDTSAPIEAWINCRCVALDQQLLWSGDAIAWTRHYDGWMVCIDTGDGPVLRVTPEHPVATDRGWKPARLVRPGDNIVKVPVEMPGPRDGDEQAVMATGSELASSAVHTAQDVLSRPSRHIDFYGHRVSEADVRCALADDDLKSARLAEVFQSVSNVVAPLVVGKPRRVRVSHSGALSREVRSPVASRSADVRRAGFEQDGADGPSADIELLRDRVLALAGAPQRQHRLAVDRSVRSMASAVGLALGGASSRGSAIIGVERSDLGVARRERLLIHVSPVVSVSVQRVSEPVIDLTTSDGCFAVNNTIVSNCSLVYVPVDESDELERLLKVTDREFALVAAPRAEFEEKKHKRDATGKFAKKPKARLDRSAAERTKRGQALLDDYRKRNPVEDGGTGGKSPTGGSRSTSKAEAERRRAEREAVRDQIDAEREAERQANTAEQDTARVEAEAARAQRAADAEARRRERAEEDLDIQDTAADLRARIAERKALLALRARVHADEFAVADIDRRVAEVGDVTEADQRDLDRLRERVRASRRAEDEDRRQRDFAAREARRAQDRARAEQRRLRAEVARQRWKAMREALRSAGILASAGHTSAIIALLPEGDGEITYADGDTAPVHMTLAYLGDAADLAPGDRHAVERLCRRLSQQVDPFALDLLSPAEFGDDRVTLFESHDVQQLRDAVMADLHVKHVVEQAGTHPHFVPHITGDHPDGLRVDRIAAWIGDDRVSFPLQRRV